MARRVATVGSTTWLCNNLELMSESNEKDVRTQMLEVLTKYNIKQVDVATEADIHHSTLSLWLQGKVKGHHIKI